MTKILITGAKGFVGKNLAEALRRLPDLEIFEYDIDSSPEDLERFLGSADAIFHLAGVNRPQNVEEFETGNAGLTREICSRLERLGRHPHIVLASSIQAELDNAYGLSKLHAEEELRAFSERTGTPVTVYRLKNIFGKWCRPNYNSVVATFCHNIAHDLPIAISDPEKALELVYVDDVVSAFIQETLAIEDAPTFKHSDVSPFYRTTLGDLASQIRSFRAGRTTLLLPDFADRFTRCLYATYLSYLAPDDFAYNLDIKSDDRGSLAEFVKSPHSGQIFVSRTKPGITRGNHSHDLKTEKFLVLEGNAIIRFRHVQNSDVIEYAVSGKDYRVVDIPPGYTHSIENVGESELVVLFWSSELFDPQSPDTYFSEVLHE